MKTDSIRAGVLLDNECENGFASNAAWTCGAGGFRGTPEPGSRADFMQALQLLGARLESCQGMDGRTARLAVPVHVSCSRHKWAAAFGEPDCVQGGRAAGAKDLHLWKHFCTDGPITCIGHRFERRPGEGWVIVVRVCLF